ncbi:MAG TPA: hypothetical protein VK638_13890 [Edaphobacter sp.]|nr:hypothetical protein [Edaphobacter sp.]
MVRSREPNTESVDDYLKAIFHLSDGGRRRVSSGEVAERLGIATASVTNMIQKLAAETRSFVDYERHNGVTLSRQAEFVINERYRPPIEKGPTRKQIRERMTMEHNTGR